MIGQQVKIVRSIAATLMAAFGVCAVLALPAANAREVDYVTLANLSALTQDTNPQVAKPISAANSRPDSLYRVARAAMAKNPTTAIRIFDQIARQYPKSQHAPAALYFRGFLLYRQYKPGQTDTPLREALADLRKLEQKYPSAPQATDARTLQNRICGELGQLGDNACRQRIVANAQPSNIPVAISPDSLGATSPKSSSKASSLIITSPNAGSGTVFVFDVNPNTRIEREVCQNQKEVDSYVTALNSLWKVDSANAIQVTTQVLAKRDRCLTRLRGQALIMAMQHSTPILGMPVVIFDVARNDPDSNVKQLATLWLLSQEWDPLTAKLLNTIFGQSFQVKIPPKAKGSADGKRE